MAAFLLRRVLFSTLLVLVASSSALVLTRVVPGEIGLEDEFDAPAVRAARRAELGLDRPLVVQYADWLGRAARLDFGSSFLYRRPVRDLLKERALNTAILAGAALLLATLIGIPTGVYTATHPSGWGPAVVRGVSVLMLSIPPLVGSLLLVLVAARTGWAPAGGMTTGAGGESWWRWALDVATHLPVPALALALPLAATLERLQSQSLASTIREPFVSASRARGASAFDAVAWHAWPLSLGPVLGLYGLMIGALLSGSFIVEVVTAWPGLGRLMVDALRARDLYLVAGTAATGAAVLAAGTLAADLAHALLDPRVRWRHET